MPGAGVSDAGVSGAGSLQFAAGTGPQCLSVEIVWRHVPQGWRDGNGVIKPLPFDPNE